MAQETLYINGRFLTRPMTGVDRVAFSLVFALARQRNRRLCLLTPRTRFLDPSHAADIARLRDLGVHLRSFGRRSGHFWEQCELPRLQRRLKWPLLLSLCNTGPLAWRHQAVMLHDAQVWDVPTGLSWTFRQYYRLLLPRLAHRATAVLTVSQYARQQLEAHGVVPRGRAQVIHNGVDHIPAAQPETRPDNGALADLCLTSEGYILAIGSLAPHKNLAMLLRAAAARRPDAPPLVIAGGGNPRVFRDSGLPQDPNVRFLGRVSDDTLQMLYGHALGLAFPSLTEGFGLPPLEAMRCGCPVVATTGGAVPEVLGHAALFVDPMDEPGWTIALTRLAAETNLRARLRQKGYARSARYRWDKAARQLCDIIGTPPMRPSQPVPAAPPRPQRAG
nr:glycosyltransferase family 1 protein [uncultured Celeribacter sp.]